MANAPTASAVGPQYWTVPVVRAVVALVPAAVITFTSNHTPGFGLLVFGGFALATGLAAGIAAWITLSTSRSRLPFLVHAIVSVVFGALAVAFHAGGLGYFLYLVSVWGIVTGFLELASGLRTRNRSMVSRDWLIGGGATILLALAFLLLPPDPVVLVGLLGAYLVVLGVYLVIAGLSLKWTRDTLVPAPANDSDAL